MLHNYFDNVLVINLDRRPDRMNDFLSQGDRIGLTNSDFLRVIGVDGQSIDFKNPLNTPYFSAGDVGCTLSHLKAVKLAKGLKNKTYCVLEDDVLFRPGFSELFPLFWKEVPQDWDLVYFGANHNNTNPPKVSDHVVRVNGSFTTHAMAVKETIYDALIEVWSDPVRQVDVLLSSLHSKFNCYCFSPNLAGQRSGKSDILNKDVNYDFLLK